MVDGNTYLLVFGHKRKSYLPDLINSSDRNSKNKVANSIKGWAMNDVELANLDNHASWLDTKAV
jgi:hypothetical protein